MSSPDLSKICQTLDKLTLDTLTLMEEEIELKLNIENAMVDGESELAKTRYTMGHNSVSKIQLPTENSPEFDAMVHVEAENGETLELVSNGSYENVHNPIRWFGLFVPKCLYSAQTKFRQALPWIIQSANVQNKIIGNLNVIEQLLQLKNV